jgi:hypothetical protein
VSLYTQRVCYGVTAQGSLHFPAVADSLCDKADVTSNAIKGALYKRTNSSVVVARLRMSETRDNTGRSRVYKPTYNSSLQLCRDMSVNQRSSHDAAGVPISSVYTENMQHRTDISL